MKWRWDQGRLDYFQFDSIQRISRTLVALEHSNIDANDILRQPLMSQTSLSFAPSHYTVWRNYARVFKCGLLAAKVGGRLICSELCHRVASTGDDQLTADEYFSFLAKRFCLPSPAFSGYNANDPIVFPMSAVLKLLISKAYTGQFSITLDEVFSKLVGNQCTGFEPVSHYASLTPTMYAPASDEKRQVREMLLVISQLNFLKWDGAKLILDIETAETDALASLEEIATPELRKRDIDAEREVLNLGQIGAMKFRLIDPGHRLYNDGGFAEGGRVWTTHHKVERSPHLRKEFFSNFERPYLCDMCDLDGQVKYPWTSNILELHHVLPLSSPIRVDVSMTYLDDLVGLCPSCHRATHTYYRQWLKTKNLQDFPNRQSAFDVYDDAKHQIGR